MKKKLPKTQVIRELAAPPATVAKGMYDFLKEKFPEFEISALPDNGLLLTFIPPTPTPPEDSK